MTRPIESNYTSQVAYTRALEVYCDWLTQPAVASEQEPVAWKHQAKKLTKWLHCMSYNDSYFGEPAGLVKQVIGELNRLIDAATETQKSDMKPIKQDLLYSTVAMQERHEQFVERAVETLEKAKQKALAEQAIAYDKTELNCFAQDLYDKKMQEGKHGHYESMFHVIHQCIKKVATPQTKE